MQIMKTIVSIFATSTMCVVCDMVHLRTIKENFASCSTVKRKRWHREEEEVG